MSQKIITKGNLEYRERKKSTGTYFQAVLVRCPLCGEEFDHGNERIYHLRTAHTLEEWGL